MIKGAYWKFYWKRLNYFDSHNEKKIQPFSCYVTFAWLQSSRQNLWPNFCSFFLFPFLSFPSLLFPSPNFHFLNFVCDGVYTKVTIYRNLKYLVIIEAFFTPTQSFRETICPFTPLDTIKANNDEKCSYQDENNQLPWIILYIKR